MEVAWLEAQTGVGYATLKRHYGKCLNDGDDTELRRFQALDPGPFHGVLSRGGAAVPTPSRVSPRISTIEVRGGGLEPDSGRDFAKESRGAVGVEGRLWAPIVPGGHNFESVMVWPP